MKKIIIMGLAQTGKTTIVKVTAEGMAPPKKAEYSATLDYKRKTYDLFGQKISMFDLGGQKSFLDRFIGELAEFVFTNVNTLIFVIDVVNMDKVSLAKYYLEMGKKTLKKYSPDADLAILLHKMDLIDKDKKKDFIESIKAFMDIEDYSNVYETNIYDESIFYAMERIVVGKTEESDSLEGRINQFSVDYKDFLEEISVYNGEGTLVAGNPIEKRINFANLKEISNMYESTIGDMFQFSFGQMGSNLTFNSVLRNNHFLNIVYSTDQVEFNGQNYNKLIHQSIRLISEINQLIKD